MTFGAALVLIAVGAILKFGIATSATHGIALHTIGNILMIVGVLGVVLWMIVFAPWARRRRTVYREELSPDEMPPPARRYRTYEDEYPR